MTDNQWKNKKLSFKKANRCRTEVCMISEDILDKFRRLVITKNEVCKTWRHCFKRNYWESWYTEL